jgi:hypothetical protein
MEHGQIKLAIFVVWIILSMGILFMLVVPFIFSEDFVGGFIPKCEWEVKYDKKCSLCGMTTSFFYISQGKFIQSAMANKFSLPLYFFFVINEMALMFTIILKTKRST